MFDMSKLDELFNKIKPNSDLEKVNTVIDHTRMENLIFKDKKDQIDNTYKDIDYTISEVEKAGNEKLNTFEHLSQDTFNMFYKLNPSAREDEKLTENAARFNKKIVEKIRDNPEYQAIKLITEGKDYESIEATREFVKTLYDNLDEMLEDMTGNKEVLNQLDKLDATQQQKADELQTNLQMYQEGKANGKTDQDLDPIGKKIAALQNQVEGIQKKKEKFEEIIGIESLKNKEKIDKEIDLALHKAVDKVHEIQDTLDSWSTEDGRPQTIEGKTALIKKVKGNRKFREMARLVGKLRRLAKSELNKSFTAGRGEKVGIEYGNKVSKTLPSEFALLAVPEMQPLFYKKVVDKKLKQYKERETKHEGRGHIIICADESGSTSGGKEYWTKAISIALLDIARKDHRNYAYIPFSGNVGEVVEVTADNYSEETMLKIADNFMGGGTDFNEPLKKAMEILEKDQYKNADVIFITDGESEVMDNTLNQFNDLKKKKNVKCIGVLLDKGGSDSVSDYTLNQFADKTYKTSELSDESIASEIIKGIV